MARERILTLIMAGGAGSRLDVLTERRAKPALPFGGVYRLIDFPLSNCVHSGLEDVWVVEQYQPHSLNAYLAGGRPWDLDRTYGGLQLLAPYQTRDGEAFHRGNADALYHHRAAIRAFRAEAVLVLSADHVYRLDYGAVLAQHRAGDAAVTAVTVRVPLAEAPRFGNVTVDARGRVTGFRYKPERPESDIATAEVFVYQPAALLDTLDALAAETGAGESELKDFGDALLPRLVAEARVEEHRLEGYWRDAGTVESYWQGHLDLLPPAPRLHLDDPAWPVRTRGQQRPPAALWPEARLDRVLVSPGCRVQGQAERSVLGPGTVIEPGATVRESVLLADVVVRAGAVVERAVLDERVRIGRGARVGSADQPGAAGVVLAGVGAAVPDEGLLPAGARLPPHGSA